MIDFLRFHWANVLVVWFIASLVIGSVFTAWVRATDTDVSEEGDWRRDLPTGPAVRYEDDNRKPAA